MLTPTPKLDNPLTIRRYIQQLGSLLDQTKHPKFAGVTLTDLTATRLVQTDADKKLASVADLTSWIAGTTNRVTVSDDGDGTLTLSGPQDYHVDATPEFAGITIRDSGDNIILYSDDVEFYITQISGVPGVGNPIGLLLLFTYAS